MTRWPVVHHLTGRDLGRGFEPRRFGCCLGETGRHIGRMLAHNLSTTLTTDGGLHLRRSHELSRRSLPISSCGATAASIGACVADRMDRVQNGESRRRSCLLAASSGFGTGGWRSRSRGLHPGGAEFPLFRGLDRSRMFLAGRDGSAERYGFAPTTFARGSRQDAGSPSRGARGSWP